LLFGSDVNGSRQLSSFVIKQMLHNDGSFYPICRDRGQAPSNLLADERLLLFPVHNRASFHAGACIFSQPSKQIFESFLVIFFAIDTDPTLESTSSHRITVVDIAI
jgi:hypothetical protein